MTLRALWRSLTGAAATPAAATPLTLAHASLGELDGTTDDLAGRLRFHDAQVALMVHRDDQALEDSLAFAERLVADLDRVHRVALACIADEFLALYNDDWRFSATVERDGRYEPCAAPALSREEFLARQRLTTVEITGDALSRLWFECADLFAGHEFAVTSFEGVGFTEPRAEMLG